jgi:aspartyl-tRNA synthetase
MFHVEQSGLLKSHHCGQLTSENIGEEVVLCGWLDKHRDLGGLHFITLRDKYGAIQINFEQFEQDILTLKNFSLESALQVVGKVVARPSDAINKVMKTGAIEIQAKKIELLSKASEVPFLPHSKIEATEDLRLKYRYLDLRTDRLQGLLKLRSETVRKVRDVLYAKDFVEVETPILYKTTPEGARDYIVPSRVHPGKVYALPQSPQTLKQLLMIGNTDRYFQICKCFRDEDLRSDRQPEFSQIDIEVSFSTEKFMKKLAASIVRKAFSLEDEFELPEMSYQEAMDRFGSDKPDLRFGLEHVDLTQVFANSDFSTFKNFADNNGLIKGIFVENADFSRKKIDGLADVIKPFGGKGVAWFKTDGSNLNGGISKFITDEMKIKFDRFHQGPGIWFMVGDLDRDTVHSCTDGLRKYLGKDLGLIKEGYQFLWVNEFPLFESKVGEKRLFAKHHPFTAPVVEDREIFFNGTFDQVKEVKAQAYDLVCNGYELGGGSIRIHEESVQEKMFAHLGFSEEEVKRQFGFFVEALKYGTPPHGGIALGLDRMIMMVGKTENIRDVIAFPKTNSATDLMANSPSAPTVEQLSELNFKFNK